MSGFGKFLAVLVILVIIILSFWAQVSAPCDWFKYSAGKDVPGRCLMKQ